MVLKALPVMTLAKNAAISPVGFLVVLKGFSSEFCFLQGVSAELHGILFVLQDGNNFIGTEMNYSAGEALFKAMTTVLEQGAASISNIV